MHVIVEGEVEVMGPEGVVETLGPGDHFGRKWLERRRAEAARALSVVRTVALHEDQANQESKAIGHQSAIMSRLRSLSNG